MLSYQRINNLVGWIVFLVAAFVYISTLEPTASFWDCGEFIAVSNKLMIPHPPGAPFFLLLGRVFSMFAAPENVAYWVNMVSALASAFTILFLYFSITLLARKIMKIKKGDELDKGQLFAIIGSGVIGAIAYTFTDSFWFSAVEAEVYALSAFFTAIVFWAMLKWDSVADEPGSDRWLIFIAYMVGLSIGVHLLNLVTIPALGFIFYYRRYKTSPLKGFITFSLSSIILLIILVVVIPGLPKIAGWFEIKFVNDMGMPFNSGIIFFGMLLLGGLIFGIFYSIKNNMRYLNIGLLSFVFIFIGYSSYTITIIRSNYDPTIDENNPEDVMKFVSYLEREQYGDRPLFHGAQFTTNYTDIEEGADKYKKGEEKYILYDRKTELIYPKSETTLMPRMHSKRQDHVEWYKKFLKARGWKERKAPGGLKRPPMSDNLAFMFKQQIGYYYWRYFGWNFVGRESDDQDYGVLNPFESKSDIPELMESKARNQYYALPLILGFIGVFFVFNRNSKMGWVLTMLFFFTGIAIILYLNAPPHEPRERDYAYAGSYYAYCIFIGLAVISIFEAFKKGKIIIPFTGEENPVTIPFVKVDGKVGAIIAIVLCSFVPGILGAENWDDHDRSNRYHSADSARNLLESCAPNAILFTGGDNDTFPLWYLQEVEGVRLDVRVCNLSLLNTSWYIDQMKRPGTTGPDGTVSPPLPISFQPHQYFDNEINYARYTGKERGDDTNPKKPENMDPTLNVATYINLIQKNNKQVRRVRDYDLKTYDTFWPSRRFRVKFDRSATVELDKQKSADPNRQAMYPSADMRGKTPEALIWRSPQSHLEKKHLIMLDMIANIAQDNWDRPIYWSTTVGGADQMGLKNFLVLEGLAYRLTPVNHGGTTQTKKPVPLTKNQIAQRERRYAQVGLELPDSLKQPEIQVVKTPILNADVMEQNIREDFWYREMANPDIFYTEDYDRMAMNLRRQTFTLARYLTQVENDTARAKSLVEFINTKVPDETFKWGPEMTFVVDVLLEMGDKATAMEIGNKISSRCMEMVEYVEKESDQIVEEKRGREKSKIYVGFKKTVYDNYEILVNFQGISQLYQIYQQRGEKEAADELEAWMNAKNHLIGR